METVRIHDNNCDIVLYLNNNNYFGYKFNKDNTIEKIDKNIFKYFDFFMCSNNYSVLPSENDYKVILDNETKFKHYFKGGSEDYEMFFLNNGKELISFTKRKSNLNIKNISKCFVIGTVTICLSFGAYQLIELHRSNLSQIQQIGTQTLVVDKTHINTSSSNIIVSKQNVDVNEQDEAQVIEQVQSNEITYEDIASLINNSKNLSEEEKIFLNNNKLIEDVLKTINNSSISKYDLLKSFKDIDISSYYGEYDGADGYYKPSTPNVIYIENYDGLTKKTRDTGAHEIIHLLQNHYLEYELLKEATAEIISSEYFDGVNVNAYQDQVFLTKKLMEIIGPECVWNYVITGDFSFIEMQVKPYLDGNDYKMFLDCLNYDYYDEEENKIKTDNLNQILDRLYKNKYNKDVSEDQIILILSNSSSLVRYYFNGDKINQENSYYEDGNTITASVMTINEAVLNEYVIVEEEIKEFISSDQVYDYLKTHDNKGLTRRCSYIDDFKEIKSTYTDGGVKVTGYLEGNLLTNIDEKELIEKGILLSCKYFYVKDKKRLTPKEFFDGEYDSSNKLNYLPNLEKCYFVTYNNDGEMEVYFSTITDLPTIREKFDNNSKAR